MSVDEPNAEQHCLASKLKHYCALFMELKNLQQNGVLCDATVQARNTGETVKVHKVVLKSAKSFDSGYDSDTEEEYYRNTSCSDEPVFEEVYPPQDKMKHVAEQMEYINTLRRRGECCDITLQASGIPYQAHKVVLAAGSEYFKIMFTADMKESSMSCINLDDAAKQLDDSQLHKVLDYIYTGEISIDNDSILPILLHSRYFQIPTLTNECQDVLIAQLSKVNCCGFYVLAKCFALDALKKESSLYIHDYFPELKGVSHDINLLEKVDFPQFLQSDNLGQNCAPLNKCESRVLNNVVEWLSSANFQDASELLSNIRFTLVPKKDILEQYKVIQSTGSENSKSALNFLQNALEYHKKLYEQPLLQAPNSQLRACESSRVCLDGVLAPDTVKLPSMCFHAKRAEELKENPKDSSDKIRDPFHSVVLLNGFVYVIGGTRQTAQGYSKEVLRYDSRLDTWITVAPMNRERGDFYACAIGNYLYVFGGRNRRGVLSSCERYDPKRNSWDQISDLPEALYMMAGVVENGCVYLSGGFTEYDAVGTTSKYDPEKNQWEEIPTFMFKDRGYHVMISDGQGHLWAIGGVDNPFAGRNVWEVERFDIEDQMWNYVGQVLAIQPFLSVQRLNAFLDDGGRICVFAVTNIDHSPLMRYDIGQNLWEAIEEPVNYFEIITESG
ncbi:kelch-like protein 15 [Styela clava]